jgi:hypothetical protein
MLVHHISHDVRCKSTTARCRREESGRGLSSAGAEMAKVSGVCGIMNDMVATTERATGYYALSLAPGGIVGIDPHVELENDRSFSYQHDFRRSRNGTAPE